MYFPAIIRSIISSRSLTFAGAFYMLSALHDKIVNEVRELDK